MNSTMLTGNDSRRPTLVLAVLRRTGSWSRSSRWPSTPFSSGANFIRSFTASRTSRIRCSRDLSRRRTRGYIIGRCDPDMTELEAIEQQAKKLQLDFLVIGGLAVIEHGMERPTSTTKYEASSKQAEPSMLRDAPLELPDGRDFVPVSRRPRLAPAGFLELCASYLPGLRSRPDYHERRLSRSCDAEFDLEHPERVLATYPADQINELFELM